MNLKQRATLLLLLIPVFMLAKDAQSSGAKWHIKGSLSDACSCAVPCTCTFGRPPSPHPYCYGMDSYKIEEGNFNDIQLDGLKFGITYAKHGNTLYLDKNASPVQRAALMQIANQVLHLKDGIYPSGSSAPRIATRDVKITQEYDDRGNHVKFGDDGEFRAQYIIGRDGKTPIIVKNNPDIDIPDEIKGHTVFYRYAFGDNRFSFKDTNSSQGPFEYDSSKYGIGGAATR
ncbi:MAG TPA: DUF1326 domain-containing protein [Candidatus Angelobacter sp.]|nr:DUF1326 domain-containing protein [Candidatus Angelobacter sp.]